MPNKCEKQTKSSTNKKNKTKIEKKNHIADDAPLDKMDDISSATTVRPAS